MKLNNNNFFWIKNNHTNETEKQNNMKHRELKAQRESKQKLSKTKQAFQFAEMEVCQEQINSVEATTIGGTGDVSRTTANG